MEIEEATQRSNYYKADQGPTTILILTSLDFFLLVLRNDHPAKPGRNPVEATLMARARDQPRFLLHAGPSRRHPASFLFFFPHQHRRSCKARFGRQKDGVSPLPA